MPSFLLRRPAAAAAAAGVRTAAVLPASCSLRPRNRCVSTCSWGMSPPSTHRLPSDCSPGAGASGAKSASGHQFTSIYVGVSLNPKGKYIATVTAGGPRKCAGFGILVGSVEQATIAVAAMLIPARR